MFSGLGGTGEESGCAGVQKGRSEAGVEGVAAESAGNRHGDVITNNIPESL